MYIPGTFIDLKRRQRLNYITIRKKLDKCVVRDKHLEINICLLFLMGFGRNVMFHGHLDNAL